MRIINRGLCLSILIIVLLAGRASAYTQRYFLNNSSLETPDGEVLPLNGSFVLEAWKYNLFDDQQFLPKEYEMKKLKWNAGNLQIKSGVVPRLPGFGGMIYSSTYSLVSESSPYNIRLENKILRRDILETSKEHVYYRELRILNEIATDAAANFLSFDNENDHFPSSIRLAYKLEETLGNITHDFTTPYGYIRKIKTNNLGILNIEASSTPVPLPGTFWLMGLGLACFLGMRRKLKSPFF